MLGPNPRLRFQSANTAVKGQRRQPVHVDVHFDYPNIPFGFCININLIDVCPENGSTEIWLGSHLERNQNSPEASVIPEAQLEARRRISPPIQPTLPKGSLIIRDFRLWHAGIPNKTDDVRVMLVTIHFPYWYRSNQTFFLPRSLEGKIKWGNLKAEVEWVDDDYDYLQGRHDHSFDLLD